MQKCELFSLAQKSVAWPSSYKMHRRSREGINLVGLYESSEVVMKLGFQCRHQFIIETRISFAFKVLGSYIRIYRIILYFFRSPPHSQLNPTIIYNNYIHKDVKTTVEPKNVLSEPKNYFKMEQLSGQNRNRGKISNLEKQPWSKCHNTAITLTDAQGLKGGSDFGVCECSRQSCEATTDWLIFLQVKYYKFIHIQRIQYYVIFLSSEIYKPSVYKYLSCSTKKQNHNRTKKAIPNSSSHHHAQNPTVYISNIKTILRLQFNYTMHKLYFEIDDELGFPSLVLVTVLMLLQSEVGTLLGTLFQRSVMLQFQGRIIINQPPLLNSFKIQNRINYPPYSGASNPNHNQQQQLNPHKIMSAQKWNKILYNPNPQNIASAPKWPNLVGKTGEEAQAIILKHSPGMDVKIVSDHKPTNTQFREDRVWVLVDMENIVVKQPYIA